MIIIPCNYPIIKGFLLKPMIEKDIQQPKNDTFVGVNGEVHDG
jgi:hypothetical protein